MFTKHSHKFINIIGKLALTKIIDFGYFKI